MPTIAEIRQKYPQYNDLSDDQLAGALHKKYYSDMPEEEFKAKIGMTAESETSRNLRAELSDMTQNPRMAPKPQVQHPLGASFNAATEGSQAGLMGGYDDEIGAAMMAPIHAGMDWVRGNGFDVGKNYTRLQQELDARKGVRRAEHPIASIAGEVAGGLALGGKVSQAGQAVAKALPGVTGVVSRVASAAPKTAKYLAAAAEGAGYGALYGSGEAKPGERLSGAATGAVVGGVTGAGVQAVGNAIATRAGRKAAERMAPSADDLGNEAGQLYQTMRDSGVAFAPEKVAKMKANMDAAIKPTTPTLSPQAYGLRELADQTFGNGPADIEAVHNFSKSVNRVLRSNISSEDRHFVGQIKTQVEHMLDNVSPTDFTGGPEAIKQWRQADKLYAQHKKAQIIENVLDMADVRTGQYTQSGVANTITKEFRTLYKSIQKGRVRGFTPDEVAAIRQMAKGGSSSMMVRLFAKFAPRGVVSIGMGQAVGSMLPGIGNIAVPLAGHAAGQMADRAALAGAQSIRNAVASGAPLAVPRIAQNTAPFIAGAAAGSTEVPRLLEAWRRPR